MEDQDLITRYNYDKFVPEKFEPMMGSAPFSFTLTRPIRASTIPI